MLKPCKVSALLFGILVFCTDVSAEEFDASTDDIEIDPIEKLFREKNKDYPGCVFIVRDEAESIDEEERAEAIPHLLDICIKGRTIGEKRVRKMYEIDPKKDKPKKKSFNLKIVPLDQMGGDERIIPYQN